MTAIKPIDWTEFSQSYLPSLTENQNINAKRMNKAFHKYLASNPDFQISEDSKKTLSRYAFHKAGHTYKKSLILTEKKAAKVFHLFYEAVINLRGELKTEVELVKPPKPEVPKGLQRLAVVSATVMEKYLEPKEKANVQELFNQVHKINQVVTPILGHDPHLDPNKIITLELLAKKLAYLNPKNGEKYLIPHEGRMVEYQAEEIHLWMGMFAYGFKPVDLAENAPPILVFSGTRLAMSKRGSLATVTADFDPRGVGYVAYQNGKKAISKWLDGTIGDPVVTGHSLGGALARYTGIDHADKVKAVFTFSATGISAGHGKRWKKLNEDPLAKKPIFYNFNHSEDKVPTFGQSYIGTSYQVICAIEKTVNKKFMVQRSIHNKRLFGRNISLLCKIYPKKGLKTWQQRALSTIPFIICMALLFISRALFGIHTSKPYASLFGPLRWTWRKLITDNFAAKYVQPAVAAAA